MMVKYVKIDGDKQVMATFKRLAKEMPVATAAGLFQGMQQVVRDAKTRSPVETGTLRESGYVSPPQVTSGGKVSIDAGFGGWAQAYVWRRHTENTTGENLFFQRALDAGTGILNREVEKAIADCIAGRPANLNRAGDIIANPFDGPDLRKRKR